MKPDSLAVIGLGAIGGSVAWQARLAGVRRVVGYSPEPAEGVQALKEGALTDIADSPARAVHEADLVVLAAPPEATLKLIESLARTFDRRSLITDVTSVKVPILAQAESFELGDRFAGSHPFAGTHASGWANARPDRFRDAIVYVCPTASPDGHRAAAEVMEFWAAVMQAQPVLLSAEAHDRQLAWTSHLPQAVAYGLARALASEIPDGVTFGSGARDTTRLAASNPALWTDLFLMNEGAIVEALRKVEEQLAELRNRITAGEREAVRRFLAEAVEFRRRLER